MAFYRCGGGGAEKEDPINKLIYMDVKCNNSTCNPIYINGEYIDVKSVYNPQLNVANRVQIRELYPHKTFDYKLMTYCICNNTSMARNSIDVSREYGNGELELLQEATKESALGSVLNWDDTIRTLYFNDASQDGSSRDVGLRISERSTNSGITGYGVYLFDPSIDLYFFQAETYNSTGYSFPQYNKEVSPNIPAFTVIAQTHTANISSGAVWYTLKCNQSGTYNIMLGALNYGTYGTSGYTENRRIMLERWKGQDFKGENTVGSQMLYPSFVYVADHTMQGHQIIPNVTIEANENLYLQVYTSNAGIFGHQILIYK
ncbi:MAG: hypothetical protein J6Y02_16420 [Pseudobutyrivibrio sp.]|nr:hypothetical protein [Pseudobutyrivibrio sp.]